METGLPVEQLYIVPGWFDSISSHHFLSSQTHFLSYNKYRNIKLGGVTVKNKLVRLIKEYESDIRRYVREREVEAAAELKRVVRDLKLIVIKSSLQ